jgi:hypothetical protein
MSNIIDSYTACAVIEDFADFEPTATDMLDAWAYLIKTGQCWSLQGFYGRGASNLIERGLITKDGEITDAGRDAIADAGEGDE